MSQSLALLAECHEKELVTQSSIPPNFSQTTDISELVIQNNCHFYLFD